jgi:DNA processing protein
MVHREHDSAQDIFAWLALERIPLVGPISIAKLIEAFGGPVEALGASRHEICKKAGLSERLADSIISYRPANGEIEKDIATLQGLGARIVTRWGPDYPRNLKDIYDRPAILFVRGSLYVDDSRAVAMVGTRNPTRYGLEIAKSITRDLVRSSVTIVSGLARGIDTACHLSALREGGRTIAVLGCGLDVMYPRENESLIERVSENGAVMTEFRPGVAPLKTNFFRRNRIVSGLSRAVVVVQVAKKSGSLITAFHALEQNRDVFAVPGNITNERSRGPHHLIKQGAGLIESADDILNALGTCGFHETQEPAESAMDSSDTIEVSETVRTILNFLDLDPTRIDQICEGLKLEPGKLLAALLELEMSGLVRQSPGKMFSIAKP